MLLLSSIELPSNDEHVKHREPNTLAYLQIINANNNQQSNQSTVSTPSNIDHQLLGKGTLFIGENRLTWRQDNGLGFSFEYPKISLHATSKDLNNFHSECLYIMIDNNDNEHSSNDIYYGHNSDHILNADQNDQDNQENQGQDQEDDDDDDGNNDDNIIEIRFVPDDRSKLDSMYQALSECQLLHPDPNDELDDNDDDDNGFFNNNDDDAGDDNHPDDDDEPMEYANGQFDDAQ